MKLGDAHLIATLGALKESPRRRTPLIADVLERLHQQANRRELGDLLELDTETALTRMEERRATWTSTSVRRREEQRANMRARDTLPG